MKWKKYLFFSFVLFVTFFYKIVNAEVISATGYQDEQFMSCSGGACNIDYNWSNSAFANAGPGEIVFNFGISATGSVNTAIPAINTMRVKTNQGQFACEYSSYSAPMIKFPNGEGNTTQSVSVSARCPVNFGPGGLTGVIIGLRSIVPNFEFKYYLGAIMTFTSNNQQVIADNTAKTKHSIDETNKTLNDESNANTSGFLQDIHQDYSNNPVSDLITMPISFLQTLNNNVSGSCITWDLGALYGTNLKMPCINIQNILGGWLYNLLDMAICLFLAYNIGLMCVTIWNNLTSLKDDFDDMYSPKHAYQGKHSGGDS